MSIIANSPAFQDSLARIIERDEAVGLASGMQEAIDARIASDHCGRKPSKTESALYSAIEARNGKFGLSHVSQFPSSPEVAKLTQAPTPVATLSKVNAKLALNRAITGGKFAEMAETEFAALLLECANSHPAYRAELSRCGYLA